MAIRCSFPNISTATRTSRKATAIDLLHNSHVQLIRGSAPSRISCRTNNEVFEDEALGIVCYRDEEGELICEGYDEGPRISRQTEESVYHTREVHTPDMMPKRRPLIMENIEVWCINGIVTQEQKS